jgi:polyisoprenoid-binding protein YceI
MKTFAASLALATALSLTVPALSQAQQPGAPEAARVTAGHYTVDTFHTQVIWTVNHMGVTPLTGALGASGGTLDLDPANPAAAKVSVSFDVAAMAVTSAQFAKHLQTADFFESAKNPTATFVSTGVQASGTKAKITGDLTIKGITKPIVLDAEFFGAGANPMSKKLDVGFTAVAKLKRSDFGLGYGVPMVSDEVDLQIVGAFTKAQ